jgi:hypothetical protein
MASCFLYRRREFIALLGGAAAAWPPSAAAARKRWRLRHANRVRETAKRAAQRDDAAGADVAA